MARDNEQIFYLGALIFSVVGAILLFATPFAGFNGSNYYLGVYIWGGIGANTTGYGAIFILMGVMLLVCFIIALVALWDADKIPFERYRELCFLLTFAVFIMSIIGLIAFGVEMDNMDYWWWPDAGFYGGAIGGLISALFFFMVYRESK
jgi:hypothetical protein